MLCLIVCFFFFKQKTAYEMRISDWSSDVCSSDLGELPQHRRPTQRAARQQHEEGGMAHHRPADPDPARKQAAGKDGEIPGRDREGARSGRGQPVEQRSEEHTSELQSLMRISYAVFCLTKKKKTTRQARTYINNENEV